MNIKIVGFLVCMLLIISSVTSIGNANMIKNEEFRNNVGTERTESKDTHVDYFIIAEDHPDILDDSSLDNIAIITLTGGNNISLSDVEILISNDMINWYETEIIEDGIWHVNDQITIREIFLDEIKPSFFDLRVMMPNERYAPIAECFVRVDNAPINTFNDKRPTYMNKYPIVPLDMPEFKSSSAYEGDSTLIFHAISLGVQFVERRWDQATSTWEYTFYLDGCYDTEYVSYLTRLLFLKLYLDSSNIDSKTYVRTGGWNVDEYEETDLEKIAEAVCECAIGAINPILEFILTAGELADALGRAPDVEWTTPEGEIISAASGFSYQKLYVLPSTSWQIEYDFECKHQQGADTASFKLDHKIVYGETSPEEPNEAPNRPGKPSGPIELLVGKNYEFSASTSDPENDDIYYKWDWGDGTYSDWCGPYKSGETNHMWNAYNENGHYDIRVKAKDIKGKESDWSESLKVIVGHPPVIRWYSGPTKVKINTEYTYSLCGEDSDSDDIYYYIDWGDGDDTGWFGPYDSGKEVEKSHSWSSEGSYTIRLRAKDTLGLHSDWKTIDIEVEKKSKSNFLQKIMEVNPVFMRLLSFYFNNI